MSVPSGDYQEKTDISFIFPRSGNLFYEKSKDELRFCHPILMPIKSIAFEKLEKMQLEAQKQLRAKTAAPEETKES
jgi:hypothetical protein